ncbi:glycosyl transferase possibly involved in lipopolysaccharide synthesis [Belliella baltica DSM 15883]|uniref:Glycosyl transferase possibly involved in lipopolysaccharide synthesis n=1 Tax=Belliella baltica (strain DSM 15883 / CIP 108006 / LMG 21964 / BA134) TaxID=866536 RepID=I3Z5Z2_BELBD|nr:sugar transferase [Belliella baltica]AFL84660.1 glycosyl transferase possibly involved in lipopolysaccharide synthesis [Belliella baltica DSM 15883]
MYKVLGKRILDILIASALFLVFSPIFLLIWVILMVNNKGYAFYFQDRPGLNGEIFRIIKFKTMKDAFDREGKPLSDALRITKVGAIIRKTSFDELPQLLNVLRGDMSMVGPRPLLVDYLLLYDESQSKRHDVKPGITGWAQINGRNSINWERKFELDTWYVNNFNLFLDIKILILTFFNVIQGKGVSQQGHVTVGPFVGNQALKT